MFVLRTGAMGRRCESAMVECEGPVPDCRTGPTDLRTLGPDRRTVALSHHRTARSLWTMMSLPSTHSSTWMSSPGVSRNERPRDDSHDPWFC